MHLRFKETLVLLILIITFAGKKFLDVKIITEKRKNHKNNEKEETSEFSEKYIRPQEVLTLIRAQKLLFN